MLLTGVVLEKLHIPVNSRMHRCSSVPSEAGPYESLWCKGALSGPPTHSVKRASRENNSFHARNLTEPLLSGRNLHASSRRSGLTPSRLAFARASRGARCAKQLLFFCQL